ncbi:GntR family transcriptional regulator [Pseudonocardia pini]|uniref:GntR family transcriptional regulator n=1 Tax=Pseudonocardia pini TaxID=2758030 RepID=UPI0015F0F7B3|nr:GntR family transcriptional regulator [Pseudonocardia pini]
MQLSRATGVPLYRQVSDALGERMTSGRWQPGDRLPSEAELGVEFGVNRLTVRQAISELVRCGRLHVRQGVGTFVAESVPPIDIEVATLTVEASVARTTGAFSANGWRVGETVLGRDEHEDPEARAQLGDPAGPLHRIRTMTLANGEAWILSSYWVSATLGADLEAVPEGNVFAGLERVHGRLHYAWRSFSATAATVDDATHLHVPVGSPLLVREGLNRGEDGRPATYVHRRARADRARFVLRHPEG